MAPGYSSYLYICYLGTAESHEAVQAVSCSKYTALGQEKLARLTMCRRYQEGKWMTPTRLFYMQLLEN